MSLARRAQEHLLNHRHFAITLMIAALLHMTGFVVYTITPKTEVLNIPIRTLNIRLGDGDEARPEVAPAQAAAKAINNATMEAGVAPEEPKPAPKPLPKPEPVMQKAIDEVAAKIVAAPKAAVPEPKKNWSSKNWAADKTEPKQYVREVNAPTVKALASETSKARDAEIMSRYTQLISLWIQKFKVYPEQALVGGLKGDTIVRIRIDRKGNIRYYLLERSTGHEVLDKAAIDMIKRANPVPAAPYDYPKGDLLEFLIPVSFSLL